MSLVVGARVCGGGGGGDIALLGVADPVFERIASIPASISSTDFAADITNTEFPFMRIEGIKLVFDCLQEASNLRVSGESEARQVKKARTRCLSVRRHLTHWVDQRHVLRLTAAVAAGHFSLCHCMASVSNHTRLP